MPRLLARVSAVALIVLVGRGTADASTPTDGESGSSETPRPAIEPSATIPVAVHVDSGLVTDDAVWAAVGADDTLYRIDPDVDRVVQEIPAPGLGFRFAIGDDAAWVTDFDANLVRRIDLITGEVVAEIGTGTSPEGVAVTDAAVWVADHHSGTVTRIDPDTNVVVATIEVTLDGPAGPQGIAADDQHVWVGVPYDGQVVVIDAETNKVAARVDTDASCGEIGVLDDAVWVTNCFESDDVSVIDRTRGRLLGSFRVGGPAGTPLLIEGQVWLATIQLDGVTPATLVRVDPESFEILDAVVADPPSFIVGYGFGSVWQFSWEAGAVIRLPADALTG